MKKQYFEPEMEVIGLSREDMILTSGIACPQDEPDCDEDDGCFCDTAHGDADDTVW